MEGNTSGTDQNNTDMKEMEDTEDNEDTDDTEDETKAEGISNDYEFDSEAPGLYASLNRNVQK